METVLAVIGYTTLTVLNVLGAWMAWAARGRWARRLNVGIGTALAFLFGPFVVAYYVGRRTLRR